LDLHLQDMGITSARIITMSALWPMVTHGPATRVYVYLQPS